MNDSNAKQEIKLLEAQLPENTVLYLDRVDVPVVPQNCSSQPIALHNLTLKFQGVSDNIPEQALSVYKSYDGLEIEKGAFKPLWVPVNPSLIFREGTNCFNVTVTYSLKRIRQPERQKNLLLVIIIL